MTIWMTNVLTIYFPPSRSLKIWIEITCFSKMDEELLYEDWEKFKELLRKFPHHEFALWQQVQTSVIKTGLARSVRPVGSETGPVIDPVKMLDRIDMWTDADVINSISNRDEPVWTPTLTRGRTGCWRHHTSKNRSKCRSQDSNTGGDDSKQGAAPLDQSVWLLFIHKLLYIYIVCIQNLYI